VINKTIPGTSADSTSATDRFWFRIGVGVLGAFAGCVGVLFLVGPLAYAGIVATPMTSLLLAGIVSGTAIGVLLPNVLWPALQAIAYFLLGLVAACSGGVTGVEPPDTTPRWLLAICIFGGLYIFILALLL
jgi:hypothetical protein